MNDAYLFAKYINNLIKCALFIELLHYIIYLNITTEYMK